MLALQIVVEDRCSIRCIASPDCSSYVAVVGCGNMLNTFALFNVLPDFFSIYFSDMLVVSMCTPEYEMMLELGFPSTQ